MCALICFLSISALIPILNPRYQSEIDLKRAKLSLSLAIFIFCFMSLRKSPHAVRRLIFLDLSTKTTFSRPVGGLDGLLSRIW